MSRAKNSNKARENTNARNQARSNARSKQLISRKIIFIVMF